MIISPYRYRSINIRFLDFETEEGCDEVYVYDGKFE